MGYPMRQGYRNGTAESTPGLSTGVMDINSLEQFLSHELRRLPANDIAKRALRIGNRQLLLWLLDEYFQTLAQSYMVKSNFGFHNLCAGGGGGTASGWGINGCGAPSGLPNPIPPPSGDVYFTHQINSFDPISNTYQTTGTGIWFRNAGYTGPIQPLAPMGWPAPAFNPRAILDPWELPITQPVTDTPPVPWGDIPNMPPRPGPGPQPQPQPKPEPDPDPLPVPDPVPDPVPKPKPDPDPDPVPKPRPRPRPRPDDAPHLKRVWRHDVNGPVETVRPNAPPRYRPPGRRVTEAKLGGQGARAVWLLAHVVTESKDMIEAMWKALPKDLKTRSYKKGDGPAAGKFGKRGGPLTWDKGKDVLSGIKKLGVTDPRAAKFWNDAVDNMIANLIEDYVHGKLGRAVGEQSRRAGRPIGYSSGPAL